MKGIKNIIVIGGNAAGPAAAAKAKRVNPEADVILFEASPYISTGTCELPYVLANEIDDFKKIVFFDENSFYEKKGVKVYSLHRAETIDKKRKIVNVRNINENKLYDFHYDKLILTTGSRARKLSALDYSLDNVFSLKSVEDLIKIQTFKNQNKVKHAVIIGSGYVGLEAAEAFHKIGFEVTLIENKSLPLPSSEPEIQNLIKDEIIKQGIIFYSDISNLKFIEENNRVTKINADGRLIDTDVVLTSIGFVPENSLAIQIQLTLGESGAIKVDKQMRTSDQHIYAAGDNCEVINAITSKYDYIPLASYARDNGHIAGNNAAGGILFSQPVVKNIGLRIFDKYFTSAGITFEEASRFGFHPVAITDVADNIIKVMPGSSKVFGKIIYDKGSKRILGASFYGGKETAGYADIVSMMTKAKLPVTFLSEIDYNYTPPLSPFINLLSMLGRKTV